MSDGFSSELEDEVDSDFNEKVDREMRIEDIIKPDNIQGKGSIANFDIPLRRYKNSENHDSIEIIISALVGGCVIGKLAL